MKKSLKEVKVDQEIYKKIKKYKKVIYVEDKKDLDGIETKDKVKIENALTLKTVVRKVVNVYEGKDYQELANVLGKKVKYIYPEAIKDEKRKTDGLKAIELKSKKMIFRKILLIVLLMIFLAFGGFFISNKLTEIETKGLVNKLNKIDEEITYVIVEINPSIVLELVNGKVNDKACLNQDCQTMFKEIDVKDKSLKVIVEELYSKALELELDLSDGVKVSSVSKSIGNKLESLQYVSFKKIDKVEENNYIDEVLDNDSIKNKKKEQDINDKRISLYKKHKYYGDYFKCSSSKGDLECYITKDLSDILKKSADTVDDFFEQIRYVRILESIIELFNIEYKSSGVEGIDLNLISGIYIDKKYYSFFTNFTYATSSVSADPNVSSERKALEYSEFGITLEKKDTVGIYYKMIPMTKFNLVDCSYDEKDINILEEDREAGVLLLNGEVMQWQN